VSGLSLRQALVAGLVIAAFGAHAADLCFERAGQESGVNPLLLEAIARHESGLNPRATNRNRNGTRDVGIMQINTAHLPTLARWGITESTLLADPCLNIRVGAWILSQAVDHHGPTWRAVGSYNTGTRGRDEVRSRYVASVAKQYARLMRRSSGTPSPATAPSADQTPATMAEASGRMRVFQ
jgi:soluble lytic murein transglycosylase-like protein